MAAPDNKTGVVGKTRWQWRLRFKSPMAPSRGVWDVTIETNSPDYDTARIVAEDYLQTKMAHPNTSPPIILEPLIAHMQDEVNPAKFAKLRQAQAAAENPAKPTLEKGAGDDRPASAPFSGESVGAGAPAPGPGGRAVQANRHERIGQ